MDIVDFALIVNCLGHWGPVDQFSINKLSAIKELLRLVQITLDIVGKTKGS